MALSSEERRRRIHKAAEARGGVPSRGRSAAGNYMDSGYDTAENYDQYAEERADAEAGAQEAQGMDISDYDTDSYGQSSVQPEEQHYGYEASEDGGYYDGNADSGSDDAADGAVRAERRVSAERRSGGRGVRPKRSSTQNNYRKRDEDDGSYSVRRSSGSGSGRHSSGSGRRGRKKKNNDELIKYILLAAAAVAVILIMIFAIRGIAGVLSGGKKADKAETTVATEPVSEEETETEPVPEGPSQSEVLGQAALLAAQYDYDGAIALINEHEDIAGTDEAKAAVSEYEQIKSTLVKQDIMKITHVFFHILLVEPENALDSSKWGNQAGGYNSLMTTIPEFEKMLQEFYDKGFVLVRMHDMAHIEKQADGTEKMVEGDIMLPPGKQAMVMSEDDVCYYEYMTGAGYSDKMVVGDDGRPTNHYVDPDGVEHLGEYDLVPILDHFIDEHPDFSYRGGKAIIAFTGYNGILGYRTDETYDPNSPNQDKSMTPNENIEADRAEAVKVLKALVDDGYELSSHSWGHRDLGTVEYDRFTRDTDRWERNVDSLIEEATGEGCDIIIYPKGADVADWHGYSHSNERFDYLYKAGFRYFANVDSSQYWVQLGEDYLRQGRRALDGYNMWNDIANGKNRLSDLFDNVSQIFDSRRPTPVPPY